MDNEEFQEVKDAVWQQESNCEGEIKFIKNNKSRRIKGILKVVSFVLIAMISGGAAGAYVVKSYYTQSPFEYPFYFPSSGGSHPDISANIINRVAEGVGPAVVGINGKITSSFGESEAGNGSGVIFDSRGYIVTSNSIIQGADKIAVKLSNGKVLYAKLINADAASNIAVIKIDAINLPYGRFGDSSKVRVGDTSIAIGNPLGEEFFGTVTSGVICGVNRKVQSGNSYYRLLQTDATINQENNGGALCNEASEIIGINVLRIGSISLENVHGIGYALSSNEVKDIIQKLMKDVKVEGTVVPKAYLGIKGEDALANQNDGLKGAFIREVEKGSVAEKAGIEPADIIVQANETRIIKYKDLDAFLCNIKSGDVVTCKVWRKGAIVELQIVLF